jgi:MFS family permease
MTRRASLLRVRSDTTRPFTVVWISHMLAEVFLLMHPALVPVFIYEFNLSLFEAGLLVTIPSLCRLAVTIPTGILADKLGPRRFIILSMLIGGVAGILVNQSANVYSLLVGLSLIMMSVTLYHPPGMSVIGRLFPNQAERSTAIGLHGASGSIGQALGTISLGLLLTFGWRFSYLLFAIPLLIWAVVLSGMRIPQLAKRQLQPEPLITARQKRQMANSPTKKLISHGFSILLLSMGLNALANNGVAAFMTTYMTTMDFSQEVASTIFGAGPLIGIVGAIAAGYLSSKVGPEKSLMLIYFGQVTFLLGFVFLPSAILTAASFLMYQFFLSAVWTPANSLVVSLMGDIGGGTAYSFFFFSNDAPGAISPLIAAVLIESLGVASPFILAIILLVSCGLLAKFIKSN